jgi:3-oxoacyl-[acyl-carrier-protein] synthase-3
MTTLKQYLTWQALKNGFTMLKAASRYTKYLVVGADKMSSIVDYEDRNNHILFGDGARVVLLEGNNDGFGIQESLFKTNGKSGIYRKRILKTAAGVM